MVIIVTGFCLLSFNPVHADTDIKMLPPTGCPSGVSGILAWDNANPLGCISGFTADNAENVGIGTTTPNSSLDLSQKTDAISLPKGNTEQRPETPTAGMVRYNTGGAGKLEYYNGLIWTSSAIPTCVQRQATSATKGTCSFSSHVECLPGKTATSGGAIVINGALEQSYAETNESGNITGWQMVGRNTGTSSCTINDHVEDGAVATATPPATPCFALGLGAHICGAATVICCH